MSNLEKYIFDKYSRWVPFSICTEELGFDVSAAIDASIIKDCTACQIPKRADTVILAPKLKPVEYTIESFTMPFENIDMKNDCLLFTELAKLLNLNLHFEGYTNG